MPHDALCEIIDRLVRDSGMTETEAILLVGSMIDEEMPYITKLLKSDDSCEDTMLS